MSRRTAIVLALTAVSCTDTPATTSYVEEEGEGVAEMKFDSLAWAESEQVYEEPYVRARMMKNLLNDVLQVGMARSELEALLGEPTDTPKFSEHDLVYFVGPEEGAVSVDSRWLVIDFDGNDRLESFSVTTD